MKSAKLRTIRRFQATQTKGHHPHARKQRSRKHRPVAPPPIALTASRSAPPPAREDSRYRRASESELPSLLTNLHGEIIHCTNGAARLFGRNGKSLPGTSMQELISDLPLRNGTPGYNLAYVKLNFSDDAWRLYRLVDEQERSSPVEISIQTLMVGRSSAFLVLLRSPHETPAFKNDLAHLIALEDKSDDGVIITDTEGVIVYANSAYESMSGSHLYDVIGKKTHVPGSLDQKPEHSIEFSSRPGGCSENHYFCVKQTKNGQWSFFEYSIRPFVDSMGNVTHFVGRQRDLDSHDFAKAQLVRMAYFDELTGLPNRTLFLERLNQEIARTGRTQIGFALLILDVDDFKSVNDNHGHSAGDSLLRELAIRLKSFVRDSDTVARLGGDEFAIILSALAMPDDVVEVLEKIRRGVQGHFEIDGLTMRVSVSIGAAIFPENGKSGVSLIKAADRAMYEAKRFKPNQWCAFGMQERLTSVGRSPLSEIDVRHDEVTG